MQRQTAEEEEEGVNSPVYEPVAGDGRRLPGVLVVEPSGTVWVLGAAGEGAHTSRTTHGVEVLL